MQSRSIITDHRFARLLVWLFAVLTWFAAGAPRTTRAQQRHHARYGRYTIARLRRAVVNAILIAAASYLPERQQRPLRDFTPSGFRRRVRARVTSRAVGGVWLRRYVNGRGAVLTQVKQLLEALRHLRGLAACLAWRRRRGLTRLCPVLIARPQCEALAFWAAPAPPLADSS